MMESDVSPCSKPPSCASVSIQINQPEPELSKACSCQTDYVEDICEEKTCSDANTQCPTGRLCSVSFDPKVICVDVGCSAIEQASAYVQCPSPNVQDICISARGQNPCEQQTQTKTCGKCLEDLVNCTCGMCAKCCKFKCVCIEMGSGSERCSSSSASNQSSSCRIETNRSSCSQPASILMCRCSCHEQPNIVNCRICRLFVRPLICSVCPCYKHILQNCKFCTCNTRKCYCHVKYAKLIHTQGNCKCHERNMKHFSQCLCQQQRNPRGDSCCCCEYYYAMVYSSSCGSETPRVKPCTQPHNIVYFLKLEEKEVCEIPPNEEDKKRSDEVVTINIPFKKCGNKKKYGPFYYAEEKCTCSEDESQQKSSYFASCGKKKRKGSNSRKDNEKPDSCSSSSNTALTLQDCLINNRPEFYERAEKRRTFINDMAKERETKRDNRLDYLAKLLMNNESREREPQKKKRIFTTQEMKQQTMRHYKKLPEVATKKEEMKKKQNYKTNKLMADIYAKKLQYNALRGQLDLSASISVLSGL